MIICLQIKLLTKNIELTIFNATNNKKHIKDLDLEKNKDL